MDYIDACKYIFRERGYMWKDRNDRSRKREVVLTRQICMSIGRQIYPEMTLIQLASPFDKDHATALHAIKTIDDLCEYDKFLKQEITAYRSVIRESKSADDMQRILFLKENEAFVERIEKMVADMKFIAESYCLITNQKITKDESQN